MSMLLTKNSPTLALQGYNVSITLLPAYNNILRSKQNGPHFENDIFKYIFNEILIIYLIQISLKYVLDISIKDKPALIQIMAWCQTSHTSLFKALVA